MGQGLLCPTQYTRPWTLKCMSRCSSQMDNLTGNPQGLMEIQQFRRLLSDPPTMSKSAKEAPQRSSVSWNPVGSPYHE
ncbi:hypothetical protein TNCV_754421 [Trichonephila clavipes]|nr:hypothetical protein TNCV_754421 [Trichonephila clavipes]